MANDTKNMTPWEVTRNLMENACKPRLVNTGRPEYDKLPLIHPDAASRTLQVLDVMCQEIGDKITIVLDSQPRSMANWDLLHSGLVQLGEMQAILDGESETEGDKTGRLGDEAVRRIRQLQEMAKGVHHG